MARENSSSQHIAADAGVELAAIARCSGDQPGPYRAPPAPTAPEADALAFSTFALAAYPWVGRRRHAHPTRQRPEDDSPT